MPNQEEPPRGVEPEWVLESLEADQLVAAKEQRWARRKLGPGLRALIWVLRVYVLFMAVVVVVEILHAAH